MPCYFSSTLAPAVSSFFLVPLSASLQQDARGSNARRLAKSCGTSAHIISYLSSTFAPAASSFFFASSAADLLTPVKTSLGADSTSALAS